MSKKPKYIAVEEKELEALIHDARYLLDALANAKDNPPDFKVVRKNLKTEMAKGEWEYLHDTP